MSKQGGKRHGAGRKVGSKNQMTSEHRKTLSELARTYSDDAIKALHEIASKGSSESARVSAAIAILDRAYGKPTPHIESSENDIDGINVSDVSDVEFARRLAWIFHKARKQIGTSAES